MLKVITRQYSTVLVTVVRVLQYKPKADDTAVKQFIVSLSLLFLFSEKGSKYFRGRSYKTILE